MRLKTMFYNSKLNYLCIVFMVLDLRLKKKEGGCRETTFFNYILLFKPDCFCRRNFGYNIRRAYKNQH